MSKMRRSGRSGVCHVPLTDPTTMDTDLRDMDLVMMMMVTVVVVMVIAISPSSREDGAGNLLVSGNHSMPQFRGGDGRRGDGTCEG